MISDVIPALRDRLIAADVSAVLLLGRRHTRQQGNSTPWTATDGGGRIVVVLDKDKFGANIKGGVGRTQGFNENPRHIITRGAGAEVHFWAVASPTAEDKDLDAAAKVERLLHIFLRELHAITRGSFQIEAGAWNNDPPDHQKDAHLWGAEYVANIRVDVPVTEKPKQLLPAGTKIQPTHSMGPHNPE